MKIHPTALLIIASSLSFTVVTQAGAASLPGVKATNGNAVPECATPGRMMAFLAARNGSLDDRFAGLATAYMRHGEQLGVRWDYAFFQMMLETGNMSFKRGNGKAGAVKPTQNNFAGLGATGNGEAGESFKDIDSGVKAHLQHLLMYAGEHIDEPVAERTRKVQEWGVLTSWQKGFKKPISFEDLARQWAPGSNAYSRDIESVGTHFYDDFCAKADPKPGLVQEARSGRSAPAKVVASAKSSGSKLALSAIERARDDGDSTRSALGAGTGDIDAPERAGAGNASGVRILNDQAAENTTPSAGNPPTASAAAAAGTPSTGNIKTAAVATTAKTAAVAAPTTGSPTNGAAKGNTKCRVWTASYGGQKSVIIRSTSEQLTNFTVLDVNDGQETRETDAYIAAYAKGGQKIADFPNQTSAMEKAFQLCPEG